MTTHEQAEQLERAVSLYTEWRDRQIAERGAFGASPLDAFLSGYGCGVADSTGAFADVRAELDRARAKFPPFNSAHEGLAVIDEEFEELKREVYWGVPAERRAKMRAEAIQVAAMAIRLIEDCCDAASTSTTGTPNEPLDDAGLSR